jgi:hypothetical protein
MKWNKTMLAELDDLDYYTQQIRKTADQRVHLMPPDFMQKLAELEHRIAALKRQTKIVQQPSDSVTCN